MNTPTKMIETYCAAGLLCLPLHWPEFGHCSCWVSECRTPGKHPFGPLVPHGLDDATADLDTVREWARRYPKANIGVRPPIGVIVLDVDPRNGGNGTLADLQRQYGMLPSTLTARTGGGGLHLWLSYSGPTRGRLGPGLDVKSHSGFLVAPPSVHVSGHRYEWINKARTAWAPGWVADLLNPPSPTHRAYSGGDGQSLVRIVAMADEGNRNNLLNWAAYRAAQNGMAAHVVDALIEAAVHTGQSRAEARATVDSAVKAVSA